MEAEYNWKSVFLLALRWKWIPFPLRVRWRRATVQSLMSSSVRSCGGEPRVRRGEEPRTGGLCGEDRRRRDACGSWLWRTCPRRPVRVGGGERARGVGDGVISLTELDGLRRRGRGTLTTERTRLRRGGGLRSEERGTSTGRLVTDASSYRSPSESVGWIDSSESMVSCHLL